jgi:hypothetical protein
VEEQVLPYIYSYTVMLAEFRYDEVQVQVQSELAGRNDLMRLPCLPCPESLAWESTTKK